VLAPGQPPEQLLAPERGCTLRLRDYNLSNAMNKIHVYLVNTMHGEIILKQWVNLGFLYRMVPYVLYTHLS
jgi:hypothetical protein